MRALIAAFLALVFVTFAIMLGNASTLGRLALAFDQPRLAVRFLDDPYWKGTALYRLGRFEEAVAQFRTIGKAGFYNRGNALARLGRYPEALAFYDAVLFYAPDDKDARANRALVDALIEKEEMQSVADGSVKPGGAPKVSETAGGTEGSFSTKARKLAEQDKVLRIFSGQAIVASRQWLATLADEPGRYLKLRIAAEHERRLESGIAMPQGGDPW